MADYGYHKGEPLFGNRPTVDKPVVEHADGASVLAGVREAARSNIAAGGCTTDLPDASPPKFKLTPQSGATMDVFLIWALEPSSPDAPWIVAAWDSESRYDNEKGFLEDLEQHEAVHGARNIRVTRTSVNYDAVVAAFQPAEV